jgi:hypothetical protein
MQKKILLVLAFIVVFIIGVLVEKIFSSRNTLYIDSPFYQQIQEIIDNNNERLYSDVMINVSLLENYIIVDTNIAEFILIKKTDSIVNYLENILSSKEKYHTFSIEKIKSILENDKYVYLDDFYTNVKYFNLSHNTIEENRIYISLCYNTIVSRCLEKYQASSLIVGQFDGVSIVPSKNIVNKGDILEAKIYFSVRDLTMNYNIEFDNNVIFRGNTYTEKVTTRGLNTRKGHLKYLNGTKELFFPFEFSFYVK